MEITIDSPKNRPLSERGFQLITFDCYGTLIDWRTGIVKAFQRGAAPAGMTPEPTDIINAYMHHEEVVESEGYRPYREILRETGARVSHQLGFAISPGSEDFLAESLPTWMPFPDTNSALERLAAKYHLGLLSNIDDDLLALTRTHFAVPFDVVVTAQQLRSYKPCLPHFHEGLARAGSRKMLHAAQSYVHDVVPASKIGLPVVWVNRHGAEPDKDGPFPTEMVGSVEELASLMGA